MRHAPGVTAATRSEDGAQAFCGSIVHWRSCHHERRLSALIPWLRLSLTTFTDPAVPGHTPEIMTLWLSATC